MRSYCTIIFFLSFLLLSPRMKGENCNSFEELMYENFETEEIVGANCEVLYSCGSSDHKQEYALEGDRFGWFNIKDGLTEVDVYDRLIPGFCLGAEVELSFMARKSYGSTNMTFMLIDEMGNVILSEQRELGLDYQAYFFKAQATTKNLRFVIHFNSVGGDGMDMVIEQLSIGQCSNSCAASKMTVSEINCGFDEQTLQWEMPEESDFVGFEVLSSTDDLHYELLWETSSPISEEAGQRLLSYSYPLQHSFGDKTYYRLKVLNADGSYYYSEAILKYCEQLAPFFKVYPNPFKEYIQIELLDKPFSSPLQLEIYSPLGQVVYSEMMEPNQYLDIQMPSSLKAGVYYLRLSTVNLQQTFKLVKEK